MAKDNTSSDNTTKESTGSNAKESSGDPSSSTGSAEGGGDEQNARIGLYMQKVYGYGDSFGPMGGNRAFYLTSLSGKFACAWVQLYTAAA